MANDLHNGDSLALAEEINQFFHNITAHLDPLDPPSYPAEIVIIQDKDQLSVAEVESILLHLNCNKSLGPDGFPNWLFQDFAGVLGKPVCAIFNNSLRSGYIPNMWKSANVVPIPKMSPPKRIESDL